MDPSCRVCAATLMSLLVILNVVTVNCRSRSTSNDRCRPGQSQTILKFFKCDEQPPTVDSDRETASAALGEEQNYYEGDILGIDMTASKEDMKTQLKNAVNNVFKWPNGRIPYDIEKRYYRNRDLKKIREAMDSIEQVSCIKFEKKAESDEDFIKITSGGGCQSYVGRLGGSQLLSLQSGLACISKGIIQHELMHAVGLPHEQSRADRDTFVDINWNNIDKGNWIQFGKNDELKSFGQPYDYGSIMHYGPKYFAKNRKVYTIRARDPSIHIGQRDELSEFDIRKLNILYNCDQTEALPKCQQGWTYLEHRCYFLSVRANQSPRSWDDAESYCRDRQNGHLATIAAPSVMDALTTEISQSSPPQAWIGARRPRSAQENVEWTSGSEVSSEAAKLWDTENWHNCMYVDDGGQLRDELCSKQMPFICEETDGGSN